MRGVFLSIKWHLSHVASSFLNRMGLFGCLLAFLACVMLALLVKKEQDVKHYYALLEQDQDYASAVNQLEMSEMNGHDKIAAFHSALLPNKDIPNAIQDILQLASKHELSNVKGKYTAQVDQDGGFLRYQMVVPVKGDIQAITQYIKHVLYVQKTLALESIKFSRKDANSEQIEANIQWVLLTQLPLRSVD